MKRSIAALLALCGLFSCSTDNDTAPDAVIIPGGFFVAATDTQMLGVYISDGQCTEMVAYQKNGSQIVVLGFGSAGAWPTYTYQNSTFQMSATFNADATEFIADYSGQLTGKTLGINSETMTIEMAGKGQKFKVQTTPIDANGDGVPDMMQ